MPHKYKNYIIAIRRAVYIPAPARMNPPYRRTDARIIGWNNILYTTRISERFTRTQVGSFKSIRSSTTLNSISPGNCPRLLAL